MTVSKLLNGGQAVQFTGIVESRKDPQQEGRVQVRILGIHSADKTEIPTSSLRWSKVALPTTSPRTATSNIWEGTLVLGFFQDGVACQDPIITHIIPKAEGGHSNQYGFTDPRDKAEVGPPGHDGSAYNTGIMTKRLTRYADSSTYSETVASKHKQSYEVRNGDSEYDEPENPHNAQYPYNNVIETESGHVIEYDDSPGAERIHIMHRDGSFIEMHPGGTVVIKTIEENHQVTLGDSFVMINGKQHTNIAGDSETYIEGKKKIVINSNVDVEVKGGNVNLIINGDAKIDAKGSIELSAKSSMKISAPSGIDVTSTGPVNVKGMPINLN